MNTLIPSQYFGRPYTPQENGENLTPGLWYSTRLETPARPVRPCVDPKAIAEMLPHGSGIDGDWTIRIAQNGNLTVYGEYHAMNGDGYYVGWRSFSFRIRRAPRTVAHALKGPCEGKVQIRTRRGDIELSPVHGAGSEHNDYLTELIDDCLSSLVTHRHEVITLAEAEAEGIKVSR